MGELRPVPFGQVKPYASAAARDHVSISDTRKTTWFVYDLEGECAGVCALIDIGVGYRIKGVWVVPELRGRGIGTAMTAALIVHATDRLQAARLEAYAHNPAFYERLGWRRQGALPNGAVKVARNY